MSTEYDAGELHAAADTYVLTPMLRERRMIYTRGEGCRLWDADGNEYLDAISGTNGVALVGHSNPRVADAVAAQFKQLSSHFLNTASPPQIELARRISETAPTGPSKTYLCPGGGEAVEAALKLAMRITGRGEVFSLHGGYHGTGFGGLGLLGLPLVREWFPGGIRWPTFQQAPSADPYRPSVGEGDDWRPAARGLEAAIDSGTYNNVAAVILELVQGPGGHVAFPRRVRAGGAPHHRVARHPDDRRRGADRPGPLWRDVVLRPLRRQAGHRHGREGLGRRLPVRRRDRRRRPDHAGDRGRPLAHPHVPEPAPAGGRRPGRARHRRRGRPRRALRRRSAGARPSASRRWPSATP